MRSTLVIFRSLEATYNLKRGAKFETQVAKRFHYPLVIFYSSVLMQFFIRMKTQNLQIVFHPGN